QAAAEPIGDAGRWIHLGLTSSDLLDTALALQMRDATDLILRSVDGLLAVVKRRALEHRDTICMGRTHGVHAEPTTLGHKLALEVRHLARTEVREVQESFASGQKGSSAMPHKRNPVVCERICGLARVVRADLQAALEDVALWHERDISHSSVERVILPDSAIALHYMLFVMTKVLEGLRIFPDRMRANIDSTHGVFFSQRVLLALVERGLPREQAYDIVQR